MLSQPTSSLRSKWLKHTLAWRFFICHPKETSAHLFIWREPKFSYKYKGWKKISLFNPIPDKTVNRGTWFWLWRFSSAGLRGFPDNWRSTLSLQRIIDHQHPRWACWGGVALGARILKCYSLNAMLKSIPGYYRKGLTRYLKDYGISWPRVWNHGISLCANPP